jgi:hypothetical protein
MRRGRYGRKERTEQLDRLVTDRNEQTTNPATDAVRSRFERNLDPIYSIKADGCAAAARKGTEKGAERDGWERGITDGRAVVNEL